MRETANTVEDWLVANCEYMSVSELARMRGGDPADVVAAPDLIVVDYHGGAFIPRIIVDAAGQVKPLFANAVEKFREHGLTGWPVWAWLETPSSWVSGETPARIAQEKPERFLTAVEGYVSTFALPAADLDD